MRSGTPPTIHPLMINPRSHAIFIITTHQPDGSSVFATNSIVPQFSPFGPDATGFSPFDMSDKVPVSNTSPFPQLANTLPKFPPSGIAFGVSDIPPGGESPMHRTITLDYAIIMTGEIVLVLDGGEEKTVWWEVI